MTDFSQVSCHISQSDVNKIVVKYLIKIDTKMILEDKEYCQNDRRKKLVAKLSFSHCCLLIYPILAHFSRHGTISKGKKSIITGTFSPFSIRYWPSSLTDIKIIFHETRLFQIRERWIWSAAASWSSSVSSFGSSSHWQHLLSSAKIFWPSSSSAAVSHKLIVLAAYSEDKIKDIPAETIFSEFQRNKDYQCYHTKEYQLNYFL